MSEATAIGLTGAYRDPIVLGYPLGNGYRWYLPSLLRFNAPDELSPFGIGGPNPYAYCGDDPINRVDPTGRSFLGALMRRFRRIRPSAAAVANGEQLAHSEMSIAAVGASETRVGASGQNSHSILPGPPPYEHVTGHDTSLGHPAEPHAALLPPSYERVEHVSLHDSEEDGERLPPLPSYAQSVERPVGYQETLASVRKTYWDQMLSLYTQMSTELWTEFQQPIVRASERGEMLARRSEALEAYSGRLTDIRRQMEREQMLIANKDVRDELFDRLASTESIHDFYMAKYRRQRNGFSG